MVERHVAVNLRVGIWAARHLTLLTADRLPSFIYRASVDEPGHVSD
jgi:hypothetical protein